MHKFKIMPQFIINKSLFLLLGVLLLSSCGSRVTLYSWNNLEAQNFNISTQTNLDSQSVRLKDFVLRINLHAGVNDYLSSGGFKTKTKSILAQQKLDSIHIFSVSGFDDTLKTADLINHSFMVRYPSDTARLHSIEDFLADFGQSNDSVESHFDLYLQENPKISLQQFALAFFLNDGRTLIDTTTKVIFED